MKRTDLQPGSGSETLTLADGRRLGFRCLGDPGGKALYWFHGTPGSRLAYSEGDAMARLPGIRLVTPERPGYGLSDPKPDRTLLDWAEDVAELADHLGHSTFAVGGESGGGPHALACAYALPERVTKALVVSSPSPASFRGATRGMAWGNRLGLFLGRWAPWLVRRAVHSFAAVLDKDPEAYLDAMARQMAPPDRELFSEPSIREALLRDFREAYRQGADGHAVDGALGMTSGDWGFDLGEIEVPVYLWHGDADTLVTMRMARYLAERIPTSRIRIVRGAGHLLTERADVVEQIGRALRDPAA